MRLACPNCDAQYEVPEDAVPEGGRDVQCSNCGHTWFQQPPEVEVAAEEEAALYGDDLAMPAPHRAAPAVASVDGIAIEDLSPLPPAADPEAVAVAALIADGAPPDAAAAMAAMPRPPAPALDPETEADEPEDVVHTKPQLDEAVLSILREEAERETEARRQEAQKAESRRAEAEGQMQTQPELGLDLGAGAAMSVAQRRLAMLKGEDPESPIPPAAKPAARRDLLPDVEEINSTLQPSETGPDLDAEIEALPDLTRGGFRSGFFLMIFLAVVAATVYVMAPRLIEAIPGLDAALTSYVTFVDGLRGELDRLMERATRMLTGG